METRYKIDRTWLNDGTDIDIHHEMIDQRPSCPTIPNSQVDLKWINSGSCGNCGNYTYFNS